MKRDYSDNTHFILVKSCLSDDDSPRFYLPQSTRIFFKRRTDLIANNESFGSFFMRKSQRCSFPTLLQKGRRRRRNFVRVTFSTPTPGQTFFCVMKWLSECHAESDRTCTNSALHLWQKMQWTVPNLRTWWRFYILGKRVVPVG